MPLENCDTFYNRVNLLFIIDSSFLIDCLILRHVNLALWFLLHLYSPRYSGVLSLTHRVVGLFAAPTVFHWTAGILVPSIAVYGGVAKICGVPIAILLLIFLIVIVVIANTVVLVVIVVIAAIIVIIIITTIVVVVTGVADIDRKRKLCL